MAKLCAEYCLGHINNNRSAKQQKEVRRRFRTRLLGLADVPVKDATRATCFDLLEERAVTRLGMAKNLRTELAAAWDYALDAGRVPQGTVNWRRLIMRGKIKRKASC